jgi:Protein of unknown function (DUF3577)
MNSHSQNGISNFNLVVTGVGYLNPSYTVTPKKGKPYHAVKITGLEGESGPDVKPNLIKFDCIVTALAKEDVAFIEHLVLELKLQNPKIVAAFRIGITGINSFQKTDGTLGTAIRGRLIRLTSVSVNGEKYELPSAQAAEAIDEAPAEKMDDSVPLRPEREQAHAPTAAPAAAAPRPTRVPTAARTAYLAQQGVSGHAAAPRRFA